MLELKIRVVDPIGIHARPAAALAEVAGKFKSHIEVISENKKANLKSILNLLGLALKGNSEAVIVIDGDDEAEAMAALKHIIVEKELNIEFY